MKPVHIKYIQYQVRFKYFIWQLKTARYFMWLSYQIARGRMGIIDSYDTKSNGGFNYHAIIVSKFPNRFHNIPQNKTPKQIQQSPQTVPKKVPKKFKNKSKNDTVAIIK